MSRNDKEAVLILFLFVAAMIIVGMLTALMGDWLWTVFGKITTGTRATMWLAHFTALFINFGVVYCLLCRAIGDKQWPWEGNENE